MVEIAEIFHQHGSQYQAKYGSRMPFSHRRVMRAIEQCRTPVMGGHVYFCEACEETQYHYHSCRNRHCPKCQNGNAQQWLEKQQDLLLSVRYFLVTFTLPSQLRRVVRRYQKQGYDLLFRASAAAMQKLAQDPRFVGGQLGMVGVLHTWGRNLSYHPHVHYLVPAGGVAKDGQTWVPARKNFLLPVKALSRIFRAKFRDALRQVPCFADIPTSVWEQEWVVHCQPVGNGIGALKYLAPYIFRVAISNNRILKLSSGKVTFRYRASDTGKLRRCTLSAEEFIRRFLQHVLPRGFVKVRYYGFLGSGLRARLAAVHQQLSCSTITSAGTGTILSTSPKLGEKPSTGPVVYCPSCGRVMRRRLILRPKGRCPP
jgi:hypothetical protein